jgi:threonine aldolase
LRRELDLRTDAITEPTEAMWNAMRTADLGWAAKQEDGNVTRLEATAAEIVGTEDSLFLPTATMANLLALMGHTSPGDQIIAEAASHVLWSEEWAVASLCGLFVRTVEGANGSIDPARVQEAMTEWRLGHQPHTALLCLENTHTASGGRVMDPEQINALCEAARDRGAAVHLDGARLFNAAVAIDRAPADFCREVDSVTISLNKGLSAPYGALLCGSSDLIGKARANSRRLGAGSVHQAGILAAAGQVALETMVDRLRDDHTRAAQLSRLLADIEGLEIDRLGIQTNIVLVRIDTRRGSARDLCQYLQKHGVGALESTPQEVRYVTHRHVTEPSLGDVAEKTHAFIKSQL